MSGATALASFATYVIYTNKIMMKRQHFTTIHGKLGIAVMIGYTLLAIGGAAGLHPDFGVLRTNKSFRTIHKWVGRLLTAAAWTCSVLGFITMQKVVAYQILFGLPLLAGGYFVLL